MKKEKKDKHFIKKPVYPGGPVAMKSFIKSQLKYPKEALDNKIEGTVTLRYTINQHGQVIDTKVIKKLGFGCNEEAIRIVKLLKFKVAKSYKTKALFHKTINIHFRLPPTTDQKVVYRYQISSDSTPKPGGYSYQVTINLSSTNHLFTVG